MHQRVRTLVLLPDPCTNWNDFHQHLGLYWKALAYTEASAYILLTTFALFVFLYSTCRHGRQSCCYVNAACAFLFFLGVSRGVTILCGCIIHQFVETLWSQLLYNVGFPCFSAALVSALLALLRVPDGCCKTLGPSLLLATFPLHFILSVSADLAWGLLTVHAGPVVPATSRAIFTTWMAVLCLLTFALARCLGSNARPKQDKSGVEGPALKPEPSRGRCLLLAAACVVLLCCGLQGYSLLTALRVWFPLRISPYFGNNHWGVHLGVHLAYHIFELVAACLLAAAVLSRVCQHHHGNLPPSQPDTTWPGTLNVAETCKKPAEQELPNNQRASLSCNHDILFKPGNEHGRNLLQPFSNHSPLACQSTYEQPRGYFRLPGEATPLAISFVGEGNGCETLSLSDIELRPPSPIDLCKSIDEALGSVGSPDSPFRSLTWDDGPEESSGKEKRLGVPSVGSSCEDVEAHVCRSTNTLLPASRIDEAKELWWSPQKSSIDPHGLRSERETGQFWSEMTHVTDMQPPSPPSPSSRELQESFIHICREVDRLVPCGDSVDM
uniref:proline-rich transmembrane protein 3-like n=1 Tax=Myxine glutinosa TaxID=7769 RepID=UPI00358F41FD